MGVQEALNWMDKHHRSKGNYPYSMAHRNGNPGYDCSSAVHYALIAGGVLPQGTYIGNTESLFKMKGTYLDEIYSYGEVQPGDIFIRGGEGTSAGAGGHTGMFYKKNGIVHSNYTNNGISYNDIDTIDYFLDRKRSANERYFRPRYKNSVKPTGKAPRPSTGKKLIKNESWHGVTQAVCNVRSEPSVNAPIVARYGMGQTIYYDQVWEADGYRWISYVGYSGKRRYVAYRLVNNPSSQWINF